MNITKSRLKQIIKEELKNVLNEIKIGDTVEHKTDDRGRGKVVALGPRKEGHIVVRWEGGTTRHHKSALKSVE